MAFKKLNASPQTPKVTHKPRLSEIETALGLHQCFPTLRNGEIRILTLIQLMGEEITIFDNFL